jgi:hypothetical protein
MKIHCIWYTAIALGIGGMTWISFARSTSAASEQATPSVLASTEDSQGAGLGCDILQVKRVSGDALLIRWSTMHRTLLNDIVLALCHHTT